MQLKLKDKISTESYHFCVCCVHTSVYPDSEAEFMEHFSQKNNRFNFRFIFITIERTKGTGAPLEIIIQFYLPSEFMHSPNLR